MRRVLTAVFASCVLALSACGGSDSESTEKAATEATTSSDPCEQYLAAATEAKRLEKKATDVAVPGVSEAEFREAADAAFAQRAEAKRLRNAAGQPCS